MPISNVYNQDCMEGMKAFPDKFFDLAIVDPPYGIGECASRNNTGSRSTKKWRNPTGKKYKPFDDSKPYQEYEYLELCRVSRNQIIFGANNFDFLPASTGWIVWDKGVSENEHLSMCELAYSSFNIRCKKFTYLWAGFKREGNNKLKEIRINHPTQKPVALYRWILQNYATCKKCENSGKISELIPQLETKEIDCDYCDVAQYGMPKILDTHLGSQSSRIAAYKLGFDFWGYEIDEDYFKQGCERFNKAIAEPLFDAVKVEQAKLNI